MELGTWGMRNWRERQPEISWGLFKFCSGHIRIILPGGSFSHTKCWVFLLWITTFTIIFACLPAEWNFRVVFAWRLLTQIWKALQIKHPADQSVLQAFQIGHVKIFSWNKRVTHLFDLKRLHRQPEGERRHESLHSVHMCTMHVTTNYTPANIQYSTEWIGSKCSAYIRGSQKTNPDDFPTFPEVQICIFSSTVWCIAMKFGPFTFPNTMTYPNGLDDHLTFHLSSPNFNFA